MKQKELQYTDRCLLRGDRVTLSPTSSPDRENSLSVLRRQCHLGGTACITAPSDFPIYKTDDEDKSGERQRTP